LKYFIYFSVEESRAQWRLWCWSRLCSRWSESDVDWYKWWCQATALWLLWYWGLYYSNRGPLHRHYLKIYHKIIL